MPDVKSLLEREVAAMAAEACRWCAAPGRDFTRTRKLTFESVVTLLVTMGPDALGTELARAFGYDADAPRSPAFCRARQKLRPAALLELIARLNRHFDPGDYRGMVPVACDGTCVALPRDALEETTLVPPCSSSPRGRNAIHVTALFDVLSKRFLDAVTQPEAAKNEFAAFCEMARRRACGGTPLYILDRGIASFNVYAHAIEAGARFAIRIDGRKAGRVLGHPVEGAGDLDERASLILTRSRSKRGRLQPERGEDYRCIDSKTAFDFIDDEHPEYAIDLRIVRFGLPGGGYENIVTNLPAEGFPPDEIREIYRMRWGIETSFRDLKHTLGAAAPHSSRLALAEQEVLARMVLFNLCTAVAEPAAELASSRRGGQGGPGGPVHEYRLNLSFAMKAVHDLLRAGPRAGPADIVGLICRNLVPVRPGRDCERHPRFKVPPSFAYRFT